MDANEQLWNLAFVAKEKKPLAMVKEKIGAEQDMTAQQFEQAIEKDYGMKALRQQRYPRTA